jgi:hypothetical protein
MFVVASKRLKDFTNNYNNPEGLNAGINSILSFLINLINFIYLTRKEYISILSFDSLLP